MRPPLRSFFALAAAAYPAYLLAQTQPKPSPPPTFPAQTAIVHVDALVTDGSGRPVIDLVAADFEIESDGERYPATFCEYYAVTEPLADGTQLATRGGRPREQDVRRVVVFVVANPLLDVYERPDFEALGSQPRAPSPSGAVSSMEAAHRIAEILDAFVERQLGPRDLAAIVRTEGRQPLLGRFTVDRDRLRAAIQDIRSNWSEQRAVDVVAPTPGDRSAGDTELVSATLAIVDATDRAVVRIAEMPGRKLVLVVAPGLQSQRDSFEPVRKAIDRLVDRANRSGVTLYGVAPMGAGARGSRTAGLDSIAQNTGGRTLWSGDHARGVATILTENSGYYLLGYEPRRTAETPRNVKIHVSRAGLRVTARRTPLASTTVRASRETAREDRSLASLLDSPFSGGPLDVRLRPYFRWNEQGRSQLVTVVDIDSSGLDHQRDAAGTLSVPLEVQLRVLDRNGEIVEHQEKQVVAHPTATTSPVTFVLENDLREDASHEVEAAVQTKGSRNSGSASVLLERPRTRGKQLTLASLMLRDSTTPSSSPDDSFPRDTILALACQVANARVDSKTGTARIQIQAKVIRAGDVVASTRPEMVSRPMRAPFGVSGQIPLTGLVPGRYRAELAVRDVSSGKSEAIASAWFDITDR